MMHDHHADSSEDCLTAFARNGLTMRRAVFQCSITYFEVRVIFYKLDLCRIANFDLCARSGPASSLSAFRIVALQAES